VLLAQVAEVVHGAPYRFSDPARFSVAHGGKDRHPYAVSLKIYDRTIDVLKPAVEALFAEERDSSNTLVGAAHSVSSRHPWQVLGVG